jgi:hypothetical protein
LAILACPNVFGAHDVYSAIKQATSGVSDAAAALKIKKEKSYDNVAGV